MMLWFSLWYVKMFRLERILTLFTVGAFKAFRTLAEKSPEDISSERLTDAVVFAGIGMTRPCKRRSKHAEEHLI